MDEAPKRYDGGPAFPSFPSDYSGFGMSLRDRIAIAALPAIITVGAYVSNGETVSEAIARTSYQYADAMLKERTK